MVFMVEAKGVVHPRDGESQESVNDRFLGADIFCIVEIKDDWVTMAKENPKPDGAFLIPTVSLTLTETRTLHKLLSEFLEKRGA